MIPIIPIPIVTPITPITGGYTAINNLRNYWSTPV